MSWRKPCCIRIQIMSVRSTFYSFAGFVYVIFWNTSKIKVMICLHLLYGSDVILKLHRKSWLRLLVLLVVFLWRHQNHGHANYDQFAPPFDMTCKTLFYWSFPYDVTKNMIMQIIIDLLQILIGPVRPTACPCTKFEVNWTNEHRVMGKRSWIIFCYVIWENGLVGVLPPSTI